MLVFLKGGVYTGRLVVIVIIFSADFFVQ